MEVSRRVVLRFPRSLVDQPIVYRLVKDYDLVFNILKASITPEKEGLLILEIKGEEKDYAKGIDYLTDLGVKTQLLSRDIRWNDEKCSHCSACVTICPADAFVIDRETMRISFDEAKCIACELCVKACPLRAMEVHF